jgi:HD-GYP domain-containing protein (c-di-GMP phosphodiesterase class II)
MENGVLTIKASEGISEDVIEQVQIPLGTDISGSVLQNREAIIVKDIDELSWLKNKINKQFKSFISAPVICAELRSVDVPLGVINVTNKKDNKPFTGQDLKILTFIANTASIAINNQDSIQRLEQSYFDTIGALIMALEARDEYTKGHSVRVMAYSEGIAQHLDLDSDTIKTIRDSAILHDVGKIGIRDDVLLKTGRLTQAEMNEIQKHSEISGGIVKAISSLQEVAEIVRQHHERCDGNGYPDGLKMEQIHIGARIMAVADAYDAMTSDRPYRRAFDQEKALDELRKGSGSQFDPRCVEAFMEFLKQQKKFAVNSAMATKDSENHDTA